MRDRQLAAGVVIAEQNVGNGAAGLLAEVPALENHRHVLADVIDGKRPAVEEEHDHRLAERDHRLDQFFLAANEVEAGAVAHVIQIPRLRAMSARCRRWPAR